MWLNLLAVLMLVLITFFTSMQGLFAALILLVLAVISSAAAFGFYEDLYTGVVAQWLPAEGEAVALMALFLLVLLILRLAVDLGIKGNVLIPSRVDKVGAGVLGFFAGLVMTGTAMTAVQMLPYDHEILGFKRYTGQMVGGKPVEAGLFLGVDRFATGLARILLDGSLSGRSAEEGSFEESHPDLLGEIDARRSAGVVSKPATEGSVAVQRMWWPDRIGQATADPGTKFLAVRVKASGPSDFTPAQFRLVVKQSGRIQQFLPRGAGNGQEPPAEVQPLDKFKLPSTLDLVFQVPASVTQPWFVAYNGWVKGEISEEKAKETTPPVMDGGSEPAAEPAKEAPKPAANAAPGRAPVGRTHAAGVSDDPYVSDDLPGKINIPTNEASSLELSGRKIVSGHLVVPFERVKGNFAAVASITKFSVPAGQKLVQVPLQRVFAGSIAGQAINFADRTFQQSWALKDEGGKVYFPVGAFAQAKVGGGNEIIEIQYYATQENILAGHTLSKWRQIQENDFKQPDAKLIFLYLVPTGTHITGFQTNRGGDTELDLRVN